MEHLTLATDIEEGVYNGMKQQGWCVGVAGMARLAGGKLRVGMVVVTGQIIAGRFVLVAL